MVKSSVTVLPTKDSVLEIRLDDGKVNSITLETIKWINEALDKAEREDIGAILLVGNDRAFSAGFDLKVMGGPPCFEKMDLYLAGGALALRLFEFPRPVVMACTGHSLALGAIWLLAGDVRVGTKGAKYKIGMNEVAIGMDVPVYGVELARARMPPAALTRATTQARLFNPETAKETGYFDVLADKGESYMVALEEAKVLAKLPSPCYGKTKQHERGATANIVRASLARDRANMTQNLIKQTAKL